MNNFVRSLKLALRYRATLLGAIISALMVAVLWGGNIGAVYPLVEISFKGESLPHWADRQISEYRQKLAKTEADLAALPADPTGDKDRSLLQVRRTTEAHTLDLYLWAQERVIRPYLDFDAFQTLMLVVGLLLLGTFIKSAFLLVNHVLVFRLAQLAVIDIRKQMYRKTLRSDTSRFSGEGTAELMSRFTYDTESLMAAQTEFFGKLIREPLKMIACLIGAGWVSWRLLLFSLILVPPAAYAIAWLGKALKRANRRVMEEMSEMYGILDETFQGIKVVKGFTMERHERRRFHLNNKAYYRKANRIGWYDALTRPLTEVLGIGVICTAMLAGAYLVLNQQTHLFGIMLVDGQLSLGMLILFYGMLAGTTDPARKLSEVFSRIQRGAAAADRIYQVIDRKPSIVNSRQPTTVGRHHRDLTFENVHFHYQASQPVLDGISLTIPHGETLAIVGTNGCGKSTLANMVPRFLDPTAGRVLLDGVDLREVRLRELRSQIGLVTQETLLFDDTVLNNIRYGSPHATREQVIAAAEQAHAHKFIIEKLDGGYEAQVGPRGGRLSGGQRQRIALARAILRDPALLILDEATSQVDLESEQLIHKVLEQFVRHRTTIIITHRLSTLALADRVLVMNAGRVLDIGTHAELMNRCEFYGRLHDMQFRESA
jgi:ATP-binding cassette subfamily B protein/subfamily B ATP-binding cassette protein MsbA